jgi:hypothetical protein
MPLGRGELPPFPGLFYKSAPLVWLHLLEGFEISTQFQSLFGRKLLPPLKIFLQSLPFGRGKILKPLKLSEEQLSLLGGKGLKLLKAHSDLCLAIWR